MEQVFPQTKQLSSTLKHSRFEFVTRAFSDRICVIITEKGRIGEIISAKAKQNPTTGKCHYNIEQILGMENDLSNIIARRLIEEIEESQHKPMILMCAFDKNTGLDIVKDILHCVNLIKLW